MGSSNVAVLPTSRSIKTNVSVEHQLLASAVKLLPIQGAAVLVSEPHGRLRVAASSCEPARLFAQAQVEQGTGPCLQALKTGVPVTVPDLRAAGRRWPGLVKLAHDHRYRSAVSLPLRHQAGQVGVLVMFREQAGALSAGELSIAQGLADIAGSGIAQERTLSQSELLNRQLQNALDSRVVIEQAKGVLAERRSIDVGTAFEVLRSHARRTRQSLTTVARAVVNGADISMPPAIRA